MTKCYVCAIEIEPDDNGRIRYEMVTDTTTREVVWGPEPVHEPCRVRLSTPVDDKIGEGYVAQWMRRVPNKVPERQS